MPAWLLKVPTTTYNWGHQHRIDQSDHRITIHSEKYFVSANQNLVRWQHARCVILKEKFMPMAGSSPKFQLAKSVPTLWNNFSSKVAWNSTSGGSHLGELLVAWYSLVALGTNLLFSRSLLLPLPCYFFLLFLASQPAVAGKADVNLVWPANKKW